MKKSRGIWLLVEWVLTGAGELKHFDSNRYKIDGKVLHLISLEWCSC